MSICVWGYLKEYEQEKEEIYEAIEEVLTSGQLILGQQVRDFEAAFAEYCDMAYGVGVDNGTDAVMLALRGIGVEPGDEVITVANTALPTVAAIAAAGGVPRFVDIDPDTYLMDTSQLESAITDKTRCILPVHLFGQCVNMDEVRAVAEAHALLIMEDCAQAHGATYHGVKAGSMSDASAFSFYPTKVLGSYGDGGMVLTNSEQIKKKLRRLRFYGGDDSLYAEEHGLNSRLDELHAAILLRKLQHIDEYIARRQAIAARYAERLTGTALVLPQTVPGNEHVYYIYVVRHPQRDTIIERLKEEYDIIVNISYRWPIHTMRGYAYLGYEEGDLPHTEAAMREVFSLPMYPSLTDEEQEIVCDALHEILAAL